MALIFPGVVLVKALGVLVGSHSLSFEIHKINDKLTLTIQFGCDEKCSFLGTLMSIKNANSLKNVAVNGDGSTFP